MTSASTDFTVGYGQITIAGENFPATPNVTLDGAALDVMSSGPTEIVASRFHGPVGRGVSVVLRR